MFKLRPTYIIACLLLALFSCSKEEMAGPDIDGYDNIIRFRPVLPASRAQELSKVNFNEFVVSCFNPGNPSLISNSGYLSCYFSNETFKIDTDNNVFINYEHPDYYWPENDDPLTFFAFSPSTQAMRDSCNLSSDQFELINASSVINGEVNIDYKLTKFNIPSDISRQFDFVTASTSATKSKSVIDLYFKHQLSQVEIRAYGENMNYNIDIAGICLGNPEIRGDFAFKVGDEHDPNPSGYWIKAQSNSKGPVRYTYQPGDVVKSLKTNQSIQAKDAFSIMGKGGVAMVIPTENPKWDPASDPAIANPSYTTDKMYFSILLRMYDDENVTIYPYPDNSIGMEVVYLAVDAKGMVVSPQLYKGDNDLKYYYDPEKTKPFIIPNGASIKEFGWAAIPVDAYWAAGQRYIYTLDYSQGAGIHQPDDPEPGEPIVEQQPINWDVKVDDWKEPDPGFDPDPEINFDFD